MKEKWCWRIVGRNPGRDTAIKATVDISNRIDIFDIEVGLEKRDLRADRIMHAIVYIFLALVRRNSEPIEDRLSRDGRGIR